MIIEACRRTFGGWVRSRTVVLLAERLLIVFRWAFYGNRRTSSAGRVADRQRVSPFRLDAGVYPVEFRRLLLVLQYPVGVLPEQFRLAVLDVDLVFRSEGDAGGVQVMRQPPSTTLGHAIHFRLYCRVVAQQGE